MNVAALGLILALAFPAFAPLAPASASSSPHSWALAPSRLPLNPANSFSGNSTTLYDQQQGITFEQDFTSIAYNVTAVAQGPSPYGPAYLLNGLTDHDWWYQVGLVYDWPYQTGGYLAGFYMAFEVFDDSGTSVFPPNGGGGIAVLNGTVNPGDEVLLNLYFKSGYVVLQVYDWSTRGGGLLGYEAHGTQFIGLSKPADANGYFTGLMTEWYSPSRLGVGGEAPVNYTDSESPLSSGVMWIDLYNPQNRTDVVFSFWQGYTFQNPRELIEFNPNGDAEFGDGYTFVSGGINLILETLSYSVIGGGHGYSPPTFTFTYKGVNRTVSLSTSPTTYVLDPNPGHPGPVYQTVNQVLAGGTSTQRWMTKQQQIGLSSTQELDYYHQVLIDFNYSVVGGGSGYKPPNVATVLFGHSYGATAGIPTWADAEITYSYPLVLPGSSNSERWVANSTTGITGPTSLPAATYYHQVAINVSYSIIGGGSPMGPTFTRVQGGRNLSETLNGPLVAWVSPGTSWFATHLLPGSSNKERWVTSRAVNGTISAPTTLQLTYQHQYTVATNSLPPTGGSIATGPGWVDAGTTITLTQNASTGWKFEYWTGSGNGSYSGTSNTTAFLLTGPVVENATYYPSIIIVSGPDGSVTYSYGSEAGVVTSGTSITLYAPIGTGFAISENPSSILYKFNGWSQPDFGNSNPVLFRLTAPLSVSADFSFNYVEVGELAAPTILVLLAFMVLLLSRMRRSSVLAAVIIAIFATSVGAYAFYISPASTFAGPIGSQGSLTQGPSTSGIETASSASVSSSTTYTPAPPTLTGTSIRISSSTPVLSSRSEVTTVVSQSSISPRTSTAARTSTTATTSSTTSGISTSSAIVTTTPASTTVSSPSYSTTAATTTVTSTTLSTTISSTTLTSVTTASTTTTDTQSYKPINLTVILSLRLYYLNRTACYSPDGNPICGDSILWNVFDASGNCPTLVCFSEGGMNFTQRVTFLSCDWHLSYSNSMDQSPQLTTMTFSIATPDGTVLLFRSTTQVNTVIDGTWYPPCS